MSSQGLNKTFLTLVLFKGTIAVFILFFLISRFSSGNVLSGLLQIAPLAVAVGVILSVTQVVLTALRTHFILQETGHVINFPTMLRIALAGSFYSQTMVSIVGGDGARIILLSQNALPTEISSYVIILDRLVGLIAQLLFLLATLPALFLIHQDPAVLRTIAVLAVAGLVLCAGAMFFNQIPVMRTGSGFIARHLRGLSSVNIDLFRKPMSLLRISLLSIAIILDNVACIYSYFIGLGVDISFINVLIITPAVLLISMLPISIAGWGVREGAMAAGFSLVGVDPGQSIIVSIAFGLTLALVSLPGMYTGFRVLSDARAGSR